MHKNHLFLCYIYIKRKKFNNKNRFDYNSAYQIKITTHDRHFLAFDLTDKYTHTRRDINCFSRCPIRLAVTIWTQLRVIITVIWEECCGQEHFIIIAISIRLNHHNARFTFINNILKLWYCFDCWLFLLVWSVLNTDSRVLSR